MMRAFVAIDIPDPLALKIDRAMDALRSDLADGLIRWVRLKSIHLTLKFLGEIDQEQVHAVQGVLDEVAAGFSGFVLEIAGFGCFPNIKHPKVVWVGFEPAGGELLGLQSELANRLERIGFVPERRDYHPHLTVGRVGRGISGTEMDLISGWAQDARIGTVGRFEVEALSLIRSVLKPDGAVYTNLHTARLAQ